MYCVCVSMHVFYVSMTVSACSNIVKPFQNKKGQKSFRYPSKKQSSSLERTVFLLSTSKFFGPSYFDMALPKLS